MNSADSRPRTGRTSSTMSSRAETASASRPITQQGLIGARPIYTGSTGTSRMYKDKRYYISLMQSHMNTIREEITNLAKNTLDNKSTTFNRSQARKDAEALARTFTECQEILSTYNVALEVQVSQEKIDKLAYETNLLKQRNKNILNELDAIVNNKVQREERRHSLKSAIEKEDEIVQGVIDRLSDRDRIVYLQAVEDNQKNTKIIKEMQNEINQYLEAKKRHQKILTHNPVKQKQLSLLTSLEHSKNQKNTLSGQLKESLSPAQEREVLVVQVKNDKSDTDALTKVKESLEQEVELKKEKLVELQDELNEKNTVRLKKHKELRDRDEHMSKFITTFAEKSFSIRDKIYDFQNKIQIALDQITNSVAYLNFEELDNVQSNLNQTSLEGLSNQYTFLNSRLARLKSFKLKYQSELKILNDKRGSLQIEMITLRNPNKSKEELHSKIEMVSDQCQNLRYTLSTTVAAVEEAERRQANIKEQLQSNTLYQLIHELEIQIEAVEKENQDMQSALNVVLLSDQVVKKLQEIQELTSNRNQTLINSLQYKKFKMAENENFNELNETFA